MIKQFQLKRPLTRKLFLRMSDCLQTFNATKIGKRKRGTLFLDGFQYQDRTVILKFRPCATRHTKVLMSDGGIFRYQVYRITDHKLLLSKLGAMT